MFRATRVRVPMGGINHLLSTILSLAGKMSHRRKSNLSKRAEASKLVSGDRKPNLPGVHIDSEKDINPDEMIDLLNGFIDSSHQNFLCPECGGHNHVLEEDESGGTIFICSNCGWKVAVVAPMYRSKSEEHLMGFMVTELTGKPEEPIKLHYLGETSGFN